MCRLAKYYWQVVKFKYGASEKQDDSNGRPCWKIEENKHKKIVEDRTQTN